MNDSKRTVLFPTFACCNSAVESPRAWQARTVSLPGFPASQQWIQFGVPPNVTGTTVQHKECNKVAWTRAYVDNRKDNTFCELHSLKRRTLMFAQ